jgi:hypothetical protein
MTDPTGIFQKDIMELPLLDPGRYENIFRLYLKNDKYIYNVLKRVDIDISLADAETFTATSLKSEAPWTNISFQLYGTMDLWWLIYICNKDVVSNPVQLVPGGTTLKVIKSHKLRSIINEIESDLNPQV